eukprot:GHVS01002252.1.p1 GENE.GHVS01002252.1~~GHVS01002252.1.p1  ORF type:complete len:617 (+),score=31.07 GHVS01002252.1:25-1875(+)
MTAALLYIRSVPIGRYLFFLTSFVPSFLRYLLLPPFPFFLSLLPVGWRDPSTPKYNTRRTHAFPSLFLLIAPILTLALFLPLLINCVVPISDKLDHVKSIWGDTRFIAIFFNQNKALEPPDFTPVGDKVFAIGGESFKAEFFCSKIKSYTNYYLMLSSDNYKPIAPHILPELIDNSLSAFKIVDEAIHANSIGLKKDISYHQCRKFIKFFEYYGNPRYSRTDYEEEYDVEGSPWQMATRPKDSSWSQVVNDMTNMFTVWVPRGEGEPKVKACTIEDVKATARRDDYFVFNQAKLDEAKRQAGDDNAEGIVRIVCTYLEGKTAALPVTHYLTDEQVKTGYIYTFESTPMAKALRNVTFSKLGQEQTEAGVTRYIDIYTDGKPLLHSGTFVTKWENKFTIDDIGVTAELFPITLEDGSHEHYVLMLSPKNKKPITPRILPKIIVEVGRSLRTLPDGNPQKSIFDNCYFRFMDEFDYGTFKQYIDALEENIRPGRTYGADGSTPWTLLTPNDDDDIKNLVLKDMGNMFTVWVPLGKTYLKIDTCTINDVTSTDKRTDKDTDSYFVFNQAKLNVAKRKAEGIVGIDCKFTDGKKTHRTVTRLLTEEQVEIGDTYSFHIYK